MEQLDQITASRAVLIEVANVLDSDLTMNHKQEVVGSITNKHNGQLSRTPRNCSA